MPKYDYKSLSNIEEKVTGVMNRLCLEAYNSVHQAIAGKQNFYVTDTDYKQARVMFKARIADHRVLRQWGKNFHNERRFLRTLKKTDPENEITKRMPKYINSQMTSCEWLMCEFINEKTIGSSNITYVNPQNKDLDQIVAILLDIQKFPIQEFCRSHRWTQNLVWMDFDKYHSLFHKFKRKKGKILRNVFTEEQLEFADEIILDSRDLLDGSCTLFTHGDFHPANIILKEDRAIAIDWETLHIDNCAWDATTLWFRMVEHQEARRYLIDQFSQVTQQKEFFQELFRLNILCRMLEEISMIWYPLSQLTDLPSKQSNIYKNNLEISRKNYLNAISGGELEKYV